MRHFSRFVLISLILSHEAHAMWKPLKTCLNAIRGKKSTAHESRAAPVVLKAAEDTSVAKNSPIPEAAIPPLRKGPLGSLKEFDSFDAGAQKLALRLEELRLGGDNGEVRNIRSIAPDKSLPALTQILSKGVKRATVRKFHSVQNAFYNGMQAYDTVEVLVTHPDNTESIIVSYLKSDSPFDLSLGLLTDMRPLYTQMYVAGDANSGTAFSLQSGGSDPTPQISPNTPYGSAKHFLGGFIQKSLDARGMSEVGSAEEILP